MVSLLASTITGLVFTTDIHKTYDTFFCTGQIALNGLSYGDGTDDGYMGIVEIKSKLQYFIDHYLNGLLSNTNTAFPHDISWLSDTKENLDYV